MYPLKAITFIPLSRVSCYSFWALWTVMPRLADEIQQSKQRIIYNSNIFRKKCPSLKRKIRLRLLTKFKDKVKDGYYFRYPLHLLSESPLF